MAYAHVGVVDRSHDNSRLCSGSADKIVQLTDVGTGQPIRKFRGHISVSFNPLYPPVVA